MQMQSKEEYTRKATAIQALSLNYDKKMEPVLLKIWLRLLAKYTVQQVEAGVERVIAEYVYKTIPPFAVLKHAIDKSLPSYVEESTLEAMAESEWAALREQVRRLGIYRTPHFDNPTTACVVDMMGGWSAMCDMVKGELSYRRKDFIELWLNSYGKEQAMLSGGNAVLELAQSERMSCERLALQSAASALPYAGV